MFGFMTASFLYNKNILKQYMHALQLNNNHYLIRLSVSLIFQSSVKKYPLKISTL